VELLDERMGWGGDRKSEKTKASQEALKIAPIKEKVTPNGGLTFRTADTLPTGGSDVTKEEENITIKAPQDALKIAPIEEKVTPDKSAERTAEIIGTSTRTVERARAIIDSAEWCHILPTCAWNVALPIS
jgi:hypothetical protein